MGKSKGRIRNKNRNTKNNRPRDPAPHESQPASLPASGTSTSSNANTKGVSTPLSHDGTSERTSSLSSEPVSRSKTGAADDERNSNISNALGARTLTSRQRAEPFIPRSWSVRFRRSWPCRAYRWCLEFVKAFSRALRGPRWQDTALTLTLACLVMLVGYVGVDLVLTILKGAAAQTTSVGPDCSIVYVTVPGPIITISLINASPTNPAQGTYYFSVVNSTTQWMNSIAPPSSFSTLITRTPDMTPTTFSIPTTMSFNGTSSLPTLPASKPTIAISLSASSSLNVSPSPPSSSSASSPSTSPGTPPMSPSVMTSIAVTTLTVVVPGGQTTTVTRSITTTLTQGPPQPSNISPPVRTTTVLLTITSIMPGGKTTTVTSISTAIISSRSSLSSPNAPPTVDSSSLPDLASSMASTGASISPSSVSFTPTSQTPSPNTFLTSIVMSTVTSTIPGGSTTTYTRTSTVLLGTSTISAFSSPSSSVIAGINPTASVTTTTIRSTVFGLSSTQTLLLTTAVTVSPSPPVSQTTPASLSGTISSTSGSSLFTWPTPSSSMMTSSPGTPRSSDSTSATSSSNPASSSQSHSSSSTTNSSSRPSLSSSTPASTTLLSLTSSRGSFDSLTPTSTTTITGGSRPPQPTSISLNQTTLSSTSMSASSSSSRTTASLTSTRSSASTFSTLVSSVNVSSSSSRSFSSSSAIVSNSLLSTSISFSSSLTSSRPVSLSTTTATGFMTIQTDTTAWMSTFAAPRPSTAASAGNNTSLVAARGLTTRVVAYGDVSYSFVFPTPDITTTISYWTGVYPTVTGPLPSDLQTILPTTRSNRQTPVSVLPSLELFSSSPRSFRTIVTTIYDDEAADQGRVRRNTAAQVVETLSTDVVPTSTPTQAETSAIESPGPASCGESGNFTLSFDDTTVNSSGDHVLFATGLKNPYHHMFYANGYTNVPDKWEPFPAVSQPNVAMFLPLTGRLLPNNAFAGTLLPGEVGAGPRASVSAYWFNAYSGYFGCALNGVTPCLLRIWGYHYDATLKQEVLVAEQNTTIPACYGYVDCRLTQVTFNEQFRGLSGIQFNAFTAGLKIPQVHMMDDLQMEWYNNTCAAGILRIGHW